MHECKQRPQSQAVPSSCLVSPALVRGRKRAHSQHELSAIERGVVEQALVCVGWEGSHLIVADTFFKRLFGMIFLLKSDRAVSGVASIASSVSNALFVLAFPNCSAVHTCFMRSALDIAFFDIQGKLLRLEAAAQPWRFMTCAGSAFVLERFSIAD
ncbi:DUF192 domain-containing protein [Collinsella ureilytica]|uniref:DUF192 domain-containing protein n=1 Tax=Collinsella ureilytica TaxID=2869515 RepID=UPI0027D28A24|nr:DUF192 domain-containing protein [Collinsella urealyticum]